MHDNSKDICNIDYTIRNQIVNFVIESAIEYRVEENGLDVDFEVSDVVSFGAISSRHSAYAEPRLKSLCPYFRKLVFRVSIPDSFHPIASS